MIDARDAANRLAAILRMQLHERHACALFLGVDPGVVTLLPSKVESELPIMPNDYLGEPEELGRFIANETIIQGHIAAFRSRDTESG